MQQRIKIARLHGSKNDSGTPGRTARYGSAGFVYLYLVFKMTGIRK